MVQRYNQPSLPSPVVGTPGVDPAAGKAAGEVSKLTAQSVAEQGKLAESEFNAGANQLHQFEVEGFFAAQNMQQQKQHQQNYQDELDSELHKSDIQDSVAKEAANSLALNADAPQNAADHFLGNAQQLRQNLANDSAYSNMYKGRPGLYKRDLVSMTQAIDAHANSLRVSAPVLINQNIEAGLKSLEPTALNNLSQQNITAPVPIMAQQVNNEITGATNAINTLQKQALGAGLTAKAKELETSKITTAQKISEAGFENMLAGVTTDAEGLDKIQQLRGMLKGEVSNEAPQPGARLEISPAKKINFSNQLDSMENEYTKTITENVKMESNIHQADNTGLLINAADAQNSPELRAQYHTQVRKAVEDTQARLDLAKKLPDGPVKNQTILQGKTELNQLLGGTKQLQQEANTYQSIIDRDAGIQRSVTTFIQGQADRGIKIDEKSASGQKQVNQLIYQVKLDRLISQKSEIGKMDLGEAQKTAAEAMATEVKGLTTWGVHNGLITAEDAAKTNKQYGTDLVSAALYKNNGGILHTGILAKNVPVPAKTAQEKLQKSQQLNTEVAGIYKGLGHEADTVKSMNTMVENGTPLNASQSLAAKTYISTNYAADLATKRNDKAKPLKPQDESKWTENYFKAVVKHASANNLPGMGAHNSTVNVPRFKTGDEAIQYLKNGGQ